MSTDTEYIEIDLEYIVAYWQQHTHFDNDPSALLAKRVFINGVKELLSNGDEEKLFHLKTLGFKLKVKTNLLKSIMMAPMLAGLFEYVGASYIPATVLIALLPSLVDIEHVELSNAEDEIRLSLPVRKYNNNYRTPEKWYQDLPNNIKTKMSFGAFKDLLEKLVFAGLALQNNKEKYLLFMKGKRVIKVSFT